MNRRDFLAQAFRAGLSAPLIPWAQQSAATMTDSGHAGTDVNTSTVTLFLCGDVMTGRGIDQILPHPNRPQLYEPYMRSAIGYVDLAERATGPIPRPTTPDYIFGDALAELESRRPDARIINLETAVTSNDEPWPGKSIHYRMHPANISCLTTGKIDCCVLANNHVLDWSDDGLQETLAVLHRAGIRTAGAGRNLVEAAAPAVLEVAGKGRVLVFAFGLADSGIPSAWVAGDKKAGVNFLQDARPPAVEPIARILSAVKRPGDLVVVSLHWGGNWGFAVPPAHREFAHALIDQGGADVVHGHSSHHVKGIEVHRGKLILYGCGDFLNDYEGIEGEEAYRGDLALMYFPTLDATSGRLLSLAMTPTQIRHFRVNRAGAEGQRWLMETLNREGKHFGTQVEQGADQRLQLRWDSQHR